jgi:superfamily II DNA or RNA helicase
MPLADLPLRPAYHKPEDDIASDFYLPCMAVATSYDRAVGYFSSAIYALAWKSLIQFVENQGRMRLICSPVLTSDDSDAMRAGYAARDDGQRSRQLVEELQALLNSSSTRKPAKVLATLVALGCIDIRIAWVGDSSAGRPKRIFHDKVGIFSDARGNSVAFKGSMNETWPGLALDGNLESVDVFVSWAGEREAARVSEERDYFDRLWSNDFPGVVTIALPDVAREALVAASDPDHWRELVQDIVIEVTAGNSWAPDARANARQPRPHQVNALNAWQAQGRRGILEHATGSGKTFTAMCAIGDSLKRGEVPLVLVPSDLLLTQWSHEIRSTFGSSGLRLLVCGGGHSDWRSDGRLRAWTRPVAGQSKIVLATMQTASSSDFLKMCRDGSHVFLIADEVHRLGATVTQSVLQLNCGPRLGLSATPERAGDPSGTAAILDYFGGIVPPPFTLGDAIASGALTPYAYNVSVINLESDEQAEWDAITKRLRQFAGRANGRDDKAPLDSRLKLLLIQRARIVKSARGKASAAARIVKANFSRGQRWIVYCDDQAQLRLVRKSLVDQGIPDVFEYHTGMGGDAAATLKLFDSHGGVVVSIRCLDEGVDIPSVSHALILASSKNPREFVQRRGRVLRRFPGKSVSQIFDVLVAPSVNGPEPPEISILEGEIVRAIEFGRNAVNPGCITDLERLAISYGLDISRVVGAGVEDDEDSHE